MKDLKDKYEKIVEMDLRGASTITVPSIIREDSLQQLGKLWLINGEEYIVTGIGFDGQFYHIKLKNYEKWNNYDL